MKEYPEEAIRTFRESIDRTEDLLWFKRVSRDLREELGDLREGLDDLREGLDDLREGLGDLREELGGLEPAVEEPARRGCSGYEAELPPFMEDEPPLCVYHKDPS